MAGCVCLQPSTILAQLRQSIKHMFSHTHPIMALETAQHKVFPVRWLYDICPVLLWYECLVRLQLALAPHVRTVVQEDLGLAWQGLL